MPIYFYECEDCGDKFEIWILEFKISVFYSLTILVPHFGQET